MNTVKNIANMTIEELRERCSQLEQQCSRLEQQNAELTAKLDWFMDQLRPGKRQQFGASSEKTTDSFHCSTRRK